MTVALWIFIAFVVAWAAIGILSQKTHRCGPGLIGGWLIPDVMFGIDLSPHCIEHDDAYENPAGRWKIDADFEFMINILSSVKEFAEDKRRIGYCVAMMYFLFVFFGGWIAWWKCRWRDGQYLPWSMIVAISFVGVAVCLNCFR